MGNFKNGQIETPPEKTDLVTCFWFIQKKYKNSKLCTHENKKFMRYKRVVIVCTLYNFVPLNLGPLNRNSSSLKIEKILCYLFLQGSFLNNHVFKRKQKSECFIKFFYDMAQGSKLLFSKDLFLYFLDIMFLFPF